MSIINVHNYYHHRLQHLLGYTKDDMLDTLAFDLHHHDDIAGCQKCHASCKYFLCALVELALFIYRTVENIGGINIGEIRCLNYF